jgi:hypothetical protein
MLVISYKAIRWEWRTLPQKKRNPELFRLDVLEPATFFLSNLLQDRVVRRGRAVVLVFRADGDASARLVDIVDYACVVAFAVEARRGLRFGLDV